MHSEGTGFALGKKAGTPDFSSGSQGLSWDSVDKSTEETRKKYGSCIMSSPSKGAKYHMSTFYNMKGSVALPPIDTRKARVEIVSEPAVKSPHRPMATSPHKL